MGGSPFKIEETVERRLQYSETKKSLLQGGRGWGGGNKRQKKRIKRMLARKELRERTMLDRGTPGLHGVFVFLSMTSLIFKQDNWKGNLFSN